MSTARTATWLLAASLVAGCAATRPAPRRDMSGFLDDYDYARLRPGGPGEADLRYRNPKANWAAYDKVLFEPVTIWRSGRGSLDEIPETDLQRLAVGLHAAVRSHLGRHFELVDHPGPGVLRIRLALTAARGADPLLDVFEMDVGAPSDHGDDSGPLAAGTRAFVDAAAIEGDLSDAMTREVLAAGVDRGLAEHSHRGVLESWQDVDETFTHWAEWLSGRLRDARAPQGNAPAR